MNFKRFCSYRLWSLPLWPPRLALVHRKNRPTPQRRPAEVLCKERMKRPDRGMTGWSFMETSTSPS